MIFVGGIDNSISAINEKVMDDYLVISQDCELTETETTAICDAISAFQTEVILHPPKVFPLVKTNILITEKENVSLYIGDEPMNFGYAVRTIILPIIHWRRHNVSEFVMYISTIEELCHIHYSIDDEIAVKYKVIECARHIYKDCKVEDIYVGIPPMP